MSINNSIINPYIFRCLNLSVSFISKIIKKKTTESELELCRIYINSKMIENLKEISKRAVDEDNNSLLEKYIEENDMDINILHSKQNTIFLISEMLKVNGTKDDCNFISDCYQEYCDGLRKKRNLDLVQSFRIIIKNSIIKYTKEWYKNNINKVSSNHSIKTKHDSADITFDLTLEQLKKLTIKAIGDVDVNISSKTFKNISCCSNCKLYKLSLSKSNICKDCDDRM